MTNLSEFSYYQVVQTIPFINKTTYNKIDKFIQNPLDLIKPMVSLMVGDIKVFRYYEDGSRDDLSKELGKYYFDIAKLDVRKIYQVTFYFKNSPYDNIYFNIYTDFFNKSIVRKVVLMYKNLGYTECLKYKMYYGGSSEVGHVDGLFFSSLSSHKTNLLRGDSYEKYIGQKYESLGYKVIYNGINKKFKDGGIDLICLKNDELVLCQCKNWSESKRNKLTVLDLRAFLGDCHIYILNNNLGNKIFKYHFLVSQDNLIDSSAQVFLNINTFLKYKYVPFENLL